MDCEQTDTAVDSPISLLTLLLLPGIGPSRYWQLHRALGPPEQVLHAAPERLAARLNSDAAAEVDAIQRQGQAHPLVQQAHRDIEWCLNEGVQVLTYNHPDYPALLREIDQPPPLLFVRGEMVNLALPQLAMVGSRTPSPSGRETSVAFARHLAAAGFVITSGLALGVDGAAHQGALAADGKTVAIMGTGMDRVYPRRHRRLAQQLLDQGGTLVSEFPLGTGPQAENFPRRNRLISGLSLGVLVVEAAVRSGSLITARLAARQGREVFAIPGSIHNPLSRGCHALIKEGAALVESVADLRDHLQGLLAWEQGALDLEDTASKSEDLPTQERELMAQIGFEGTSLDTLQQRTGLPTGELLSLLMTLEIKGAVSQGADGYQRVKG